LVVVDVPDRRSGAWCVKGAHVMVQGILDNAAEFTAEQIASEIYELPVAVVRRILGNAAAYGSCGELGRAQGQLSTQTV